MTGSIGLSVYYIKHFYPFNLDNFGHQSRRWHYKLLNSMFLHSYHPDATNRRVTFFARYLKEWQ